MGFLVFWSIEFGFMSRLYGTWGMYFSPLEGCVTVYLPELNGVAVKSMLPVGKFADVAVFPVSALTNVATSVVVIVIVPREVLVCRPDIALKLNSVSMGAIGSSNLYSSIEVSSFNGDLAFFMESLKPALMCIDSMTPLNSPPLPPMNTLELDFDMVSGLSINDLDAIRSPLT